MTIDKADFVGVILASFVFGVALGGICAANIEKNFARDNILKHNAGKYVIIDPANGTTKLMWNDEIEKTNKGK